MVSNDSKALTENQADALSRPNTLMEIAIGMKRRRSLFLWLVGFSLFLVWAHHFSTAKFEATSTLLLQREDVSPLQALLGVKSPGASVSLANAKSSNIFDRYLLFLNSPEFFVQVARDLNSKPEWAEEAKRMSKEPGFVSRLLYDFSGDLSSEGSKVERISKTLGRITKFKKSGFDNIHVQVTTKNAERSVRLVNFIADTAISVVRDREMNELNTAKNFVEDELKGSENKLSRIDTSVIDFRKKSKYVLTDTMPREIADRINGIQKSMNELELRYEQNEKLSNTLTTELKKHEKALFVDGTIDVKSLDSVSQIRSRLEYLRNKKSTMLAQGYELKSGPMQDIDREIETSSHRLKELMNSMGEGEGDVVPRGFDTGLASKIAALKKENRYLAVNIETHKKQLHEAMGMLSNLPEAQQALVGFNRQSQIEYSLFQDLRRRLLEIELHKISLRDKIKVIEPSSIASVPAPFRFAPKIFVSLFLAVVMFTLGVLLLESQENTVRSLSDLADIGGWIPMRVAAGSETSGVEAIACALSMATTAEGNPLHTLTVCAPRNSKVTRDFTRRLSDGCVSLGRPELKIETTAPVFPSIEAVKSAGHADLVLLVCEYRRTTRSEAEAAVHRLKQFSGKPVMPVLWGVPDAWESELENNQRAKSFFARWRAFLFSSQGMSTQEV